MSDANDLANLEGGDEILLGQAIHEGGSSAVQNSLMPDYSPSSNLAERPKVVESTLRNGNTAASDATSSSLPDTRVAMSTFSFKSPFGAPDNTEKNLEAQKENLFKVNQPASMSQTPSPGDALSSFSARSAVIPFSQMSAKDLVKVVADKIHGLDSGPWITDDVSGAAILGHVLPSVLSEFLENVLKITTPFIKSRIQSILVTLIQEDLSIAKHIRDAWLTSTAANVVRTVSTDVRQNLFSTPTHGEFSRANTASTPAFFCGGSGRRSQCTSSTPSFLKECGSTEDFCLEDTSLFAQTTRASTTASNMNFGGAQAAGGGGVFAITINQPSATPPKYIILECASDSEAFYNWILKNRKESLLALPVDRRTLSQLVSHEVKDEVARILKQLGPSNTFYFNPVNSPYPKSWPEVSDHLLLKILFGINGPRSAAEAKLRLKGRAFFFNDSTTSQDKFTTKLRKFFSGFKETLKDFAYTWHLWEEHDKLDHPMIIEAFSECFSNSDQIKGPDGTTMVPKSRNHAKIREMIRERKSQSLEEIMNFIVDSYERIDIAVRSSRSITYEVKPWKCDDSKGKKRKFNQVSGQSDQSVNAKKPPRPPAEHPRCANCGRKSHLCGERSCYLFGHPKGRGANGTWKEGEPSLFIEAGEMKTWKSTRDPVFYSYPENKREPKSKKTDA